MATVLWRSYGRSSDAKVTYRKVPTLSSTLPILGNLLDMEPHSRQYPYTIHEWFHQQCRRFDFEPWRVFLPGQTPLVVISSAEALDEIMVSQFDNFPKGEDQLDLLQVFFGKSVVASDGERWYHQRKTAVRFFTARSLNAFMCESMKRNIGLVSDEVERSIQAGQSVNLTKLFHEFTMQTFAETGLGVRLDWIGAEKPHPFAEALDESGPLVTRRFHLPLWWWRLERWLNIGPEARLAKHMQYARNWISEMAHKSLAESMRKHADRQRDAHASATRSQEPTVKSMIDLFAEFSREDAEGMRSHDLVEFVQVMVIASRDTTALSSIWFFFERGRHPEIERRRREEMAKKFPDLVGDRSAYLASEHTRQLPLLEATLREAMRVHPPTPFTYKEVAKDTVICGDVQLHKGERVALTTYALSRNTKLWGQDATEFKPDRWIDDKTGHLRQFPATKFFAFNAGPRQCVGMNLALLEMTVVAANLLNRFRFETDPSVDDSVIRAPLLVMKHDLTVRARPVAPAAA